MKKVYFRYKQSLKEKASEATFEVCFTSPKSFQKERESHFSFPPKIYEVDEECLLMPAECDEKISEIMLYFKEKIVELIGEPPDAIGILVYNDDGKMEHFPRHITYLTHSAWPMIGEDTKETQNKIDIECIERNKRLFEIYLKLKLNHV